MGNLGNLGNLYFHQNQFQDAEKTLEQAVELYREAQSVHGESECLHCLGKLYLHQNQADNAEWVLQHALNLYRPK